MTVLMMTALLMVSGGWQYIQPVHKQISPSHLDKILREVKGQAGRLKQYKYLVRISFTALKKGSESVLLVNDVPALSVAAGWSRGRGRSLITVSPYNGCKWDASKLMHVCPTAGIAGEGAVVMDDVIRKKRALVVSFRKGARTVFWLAYSKAPGSFYYLDLVDVGGDSLKHLGRHKVEAQLFEVKAQPSPKLPPEPPTSGQPDGSAGVSLKKRAASGSSDGATGDSGNMPPPAPTDKTVQSKKPEVDKPVNTLGSHKTRPPAAKRRFRRRLLFKKTGITLDRALTLDRLNAPMEVYGYRKFVWVRVEGSDIRSITFSFPEPPVRAYIYAWTPSRKRKNVLMGASQACGKECTYRIDGLRWYFVPRNALRRFFTVRTTSGKAKMVAWFAFRRLSDDIIVWGKSTVHAFRWLPEAGKSQGSFHPVEMRQKIVSSDTFIRMLRLLGLSRWRILEGYPYVVMLSVTPGSEDVQTILMRLNLPDGVKPAVVLARSYPMARARSVRFMAQAGPASMCSLGAKPFCPYHFHGLNWNDLTPAFVRRGGMAAKKVGLVLRKKGPRSPRRVILLMAFRDSLPRNFISILTKPEHQGRPSVKVMLYAVSWQEGDILERPLEY